MEQLSHVDYVTTNAHSSHGAFQLYVFEDNEAVIKTIIKGRSPTMRHVSRTHRVALDWLFDRIGLDPKIQIKYVDTKNQLADMLTKGSFTRDEWDHLLRLLNIMNSRCFLAAAKPRPMSLVSKNLLSAKENPLRKIRVHRTAWGIKSWVRQDDTLSSGTRKLVQSGESSSSASTRKLVRGDDSQIERTKLEFHNLQICDHRYLEKVFKNLRQKLNSRRRGTST